MVFDNIFKDDFYYCHWQYELIHFLPHYIKELFRQKSLRVETKKSLIKDEQKIWVKVDEFKNFELIILSTYEKKRENYFILDVINQNIPYFELLEKSMEGKLDEILKKNMKI